MITFDAFSKRLIRGQLKNTSAVSVADINVVSTDAVETLLMLTNQGLVDLCTRFPLITRQIDLIFQTDRYDYPITSTGVGSYLDTSITEAFDDNFIKVVDVLDEDGKSHPIDTNGHIITPTFDVLRFTSAMMTTLGEKVRIRYQTKHPVVAADSTIAIPPNLETALQLFVSALYISHMNSPELTKKGDSYYGAYLRHVNEDTQRNTSSTSEVDQDTRLSDRGFV
jgi:hypothetical protein